MKRPTGFVVAIQMDHEQMRVCPSLNVNESVDWASEGIELPTSRSVAISKSRALAIPSVSRNLFHAFLFWHARCCPTLPTPKTVGMEPLRDKSPSPSAPPVPNCPRFLALSQFPANPPLSTAGCKPNVIAWFPKLRRWHLVEVCQRRSGEEK